MLRDIVYKEKGTATGVRVLSHEADGTTLEVCITTEGTIRDVAHTTLWTYWSTVRLDGSMYGEGKGLLTTKDGEIIQLLGSGTAPGAEPDGTIRYRGAVYFTTEAERFTDLNGLAGVHEYDQAPDGNASVTCWEWK